MTPEQAAAGWTLGLLGLWGVRWICRWWDRRQASRPMYVSDRWRREHGYWKGGDEL